MDKFVSPFVMIGAFVVFVAVSMGYEIVAFLRTKPAEAAVPVEKDRSR